MIVIYDAILNFFVTRKLALLKKPSMINDEYNINKKRLLRFAYENRLILYGLLIYSKENNENIIKMSLECTYHENNDEINDSQDFYADDEHNRKKENDKISTIDGKNIYNVIIGTNG